MAHREHTCKLLGAIQEGLLDRDAVIIAALNHLSDSEVRDMCEANGFFEHEEDEAVEEEDEDPLDNFNWVGSRHHY